MSETITHRVLGLMSGSSLDGLDMAYCKFRCTHSPTFELLDWQLLAHDTLAYTKKWQERLATLIHDDAKTFVATHADYGRYMAELVNTFLTKTEIEPDFIASHGHTIFHFPDQHFTTQIGDGAALAASTGYPVISEMRSMDVAAGGQGAPIAPIADDYLLGKYDFYLNLGGIANVTVRQAEKWTAFDITGANQILNAIVSEEGKAYDDGGQLAATGKVLAALLQESNQLDFLKKSPPKTLDNQWVQKELLPIFKMKQFSVADRLRTACEHIAYQIVQSIKQFVPKNKPATMLVTGGGANNRFFLKCLEKHLKTLGNIGLEVPEKAIAEFKEAAMIALMGVMRLHNFPNCKSSVTGAERDTINGCIYQGWKKHI